MLWAGWAIKKTSLDALPDISDTQVIIFTEWQGRSPDIIEDQITYPLVTTFLAAPKVKTVRGFTMFGLSFVTGRLVDKLGRSRMILAGGMTLSLAAISLK